MKGQKCVRKDCTYRKGTDDCTRPATSCRGFRVKPSKGKRFRRVRNG